VTDGFAHSTAVDKATDVIRAVYSEVRACVRLCLYAIVVPVLYVRVQSHHAHAQLPTYDKLIPALLLPDGLATLRDRWCVLRAVGACM
jgi:hypothetical protein